MPLSPDSGRASLPPALEADLARQYEILRLLGAGGMGTVWLARERSLDRLVAIKVLAGDSVTTAGVRERFRREARIAARLMHPNIVPLYAFGETTDALYFAMGYVEGESLAALLEREGRLPRATIVRILGDISDALAFAHREGVIHRDVKPENILLDAKSGRAMLADFGIARLEDATATAVTMTGVAVGTPSYMSPEQAASTQAVDGRTDLYSLGIVGYRMLHGRLPFVGGALAVMAQHASAKPADLTLAVPAGDRELARLIMRAIEKDPDARWGSAEELRDELQTIAAEGAPLPEGLQRVEMIGTKFLVADAAIGSIFYISWLAIPEFRSDPKFWPLFAANLAFLPALGVAWAAPTIRKFGWKETLRAMLLPPRSWTHWWPRAFRRVDDIWDRLPSPFRRLRAVMDGVAAYLVIDIAHFLVVATTGGGAYGDWVLSVMRTPTGLVLLGAIRGLLPVAWVGYEVMRARRKLGVSMRELMQMLGASHLSSSHTWTKPKFARLLASESPELPAGQAPRSPEELVVAIKSLAGRLRTAGLLPDDETISAAGAVRDGIAALEAEIERLNAELDPLEGERIARRLARLGNSEDDSELRGMLEGQLALLKRLEERVRNKE
jgi:hypothetical protein